MKAFDGTRVVYVKVVNGKKNGGKPYFMIMRKMDGVREKGMKVEFLGILKDRGINDYEVKTTIGDMEFARNVYEGKIKDVMGQVERDNLMMVIKEEMPRMNMGIEWGRHNDQERRFFMFIVNDFYRKRQEVNGLNYL
jgi:hypothetical protein